MLSKCANPACKTPFRYLHDGRLYQMETGVSTPDHPDQKKAVRRVEYFWLCNECAVKLTLRYERGLGVTTVPIAQAQHAAAS